MEQSNIIELPIRDERGFNIIGKRFSLEESPLKQKVFELLTNTSWWDFLTFLANKKFVTLEEWEYLKGQLKRSAYYKLTETIGREIAVLFCKKAKYNQATFSELVACLHILLLIVDMVDKNGQAWYLLNEIKHNCSIVDRQDVKLSVCSDWVLPSDIICFEDPLKLIFPYPKKPGKFILIGGLKSEQQTGIYDNNTSYRATDIVVLDEPDNEFIASASNTILDSLFAKTYGDEIPNPVELAEMDRNNVLFVGDSVISTVNMKGVITTNDGLTISYVSIKGNATVNLPIGNYEGKLYIRDYLATKLV